MARCRSGSGEIIVNFDELWPSYPWSADTKQAGKLPGKDAFQNLHICGKEVPRGYWVFFTPYRFSKLFLICCSTLLYIRR
jgi:hypothetical protein